MPDLSTITPVTREEEFLDRISRKIGGGLPEVDSSDNGDVLTVVDGEWAAAAPSGGETPFVLNVYAGEKDIDSVTTPIHYILDADIAPLIAWQRPSVVVLRMIFEDPDTAYDYPTYLSLSQRNDSGLFEEDNLWTKAVGIVADTGLENKQLLTERFIEIVNNGEGADVLFSTDPAVVQKAAPAEHDDVNGYYYVTAEV